MALFRSCEADFAELTPTPLDNENNKQTTTQGPFDKSSKSGRKRLHYENIHTVFLLFFLISKFLCTSQTYEDTNKNNLLLIC